VQSGNAPSKVGWSTQRKQEGARRNRTLYFVTGGVAAVAIAGTLLLAGAGETGGAALTAPSALAPAGTTVEPQAGSVEVAMQLRSNVDGARFSIDGVGVPGGLVRGRKGETKKVRVEADGYAAVLAEVTLDPAMESMEIPLAVTMEPQAVPNPGAGAMRAPDVAPATSVASSTTPIVSVGAPEATGAPPAGPGAKTAGSAKGGNRKPPSSVKTAQPSTLPPPSTAAPDPGGVANKLKIKTD
jgi:serine/threonine-protein kinase